MQRRSRRLAALLGTLLGALLLASGCSNGGDADGGVHRAPGTDPRFPRTRYSLNNQCFVLRSNATGKYVRAAGGGYAATADLVSAAEPFFLKPAALGSYLLYDGSRLLMASGAPVATESLDAASEAAVWTVKVIGDTTAYPAAPVYDVEPATADLDAYRSFVDPNRRSTEFGLASGASKLVVDGSGALTTAAAGGAASPAESFTFVAAVGCKAFPEAEDDTSGETFKGTTADGNVLGMADVHVHISSTTFLGGGLWGAPFHKFGVTHALADCGADSTSTDPSTGARPHGPQGSRDIIGAFLASDFNGHATAGYPAFTDWPAAENLTHQAIYWKWLERGWKAGLRIAVNDVVENGTLCELERNNSNDPAHDCNEMNSAGRQVGTMYAMQDYIDAQSGGRGAGWFRIVLDPDQARGVVEQGKLAVVLGIEISNFLNCQVTYQPTRTQEPWQEDGAGGTENSYACKMTETGAPDEILTQMNRVYDWGVRQVISIHEFDNAFGGNGVFFPLINVGNRENSGGLPSGTSSEAFDVSQTPTGEYWTTYDCPSEGDAGFSGYLWDSSGGASGADLRSVGTPLPLPAGCPPTGQGGRYGGTTACYPDAQQCNARWMTPIGVYMYSKLMQKGFLFDFDHMELHMKSQALDLTEAQPIAYPIVSTHGTFGGTSLEQARRVLKNGGFIYPSLGGSASFLGEMTETLQVYADATAGMDPATVPLFGFGFGTDTNGLSGQAGTEDISVPGNDKGYPYTLFRGGVFEQLPEFVAVNAPVTFAQPASHDADGQLARTWDIATDGSAQYGMLSDFVEAVNRHGTAAQMRNLFNSAERYLRTWETTLDASAAIQAQGSVTVPPGVLVAAPSPSAPGYPAGD